MGTTTRWRAGAAATMAVLALAGGVTSCRRVDDAVDARTSNQSPTTSATGTTGTTGASTTTTAATGGTALGGPRGATSTAPTTATAGTGAAPSAGCGTPPPPSGDDSIDVAGTHRTYHLDVPSGASGDPHPLVFDLHGLGSNAKKEVAYTHLGRDAAARGYVAITPDSTGTMWYLPPTPGSAADADFIKALIDTTAATQCIDLHRVYLAGISNGAAFTGALSCSLAGQLAGVGMIAGPNAWRPCTDQAPVPLISFHGTDDPLVPYAGGHLFSGLPAGGRAGEAAPNDPKAFGGEGAGAIVVKPAEEALAGWAQRNGCTTGPTTTAVSAHVSLIAYGSCHDGADTQLYKIDGGGHTWPGAVGVGQALLGPTTQEISATAVLLDFFDAHRR